MRTLALVASLLVFTSAAAVGPGVAAADAETVTLTVSVTTTDGAPVEGATLEATWENGSRTATTAANGKAFVDVPRGATVTIAVSHPEYVRNDPVIVENATARDVSITVAAKATATIAVTSAGDGAVDGATVTLSRDGETVFTGTTENGSVSTGTLMAGTYDLTVSEPGFYTNETTLTIENETEATVTLERGTVRLTVNVTDAYFEPPRPVSGATVAIEGVGSLLTPADGTQYLSVPVNTELSVSVSKSGYQTVERTVTVAASDMRLAVDLDRSPALHVSLMSDRVVVGEQVLVTVRDEYGDRVANATVLIEGEAVATTDADGTASVTVPHAGNVSVSAALDGTAATPVLVHGVAVGTTTTVATTTATAAPPTSATTSTTGGPIPDLPGEYVPLAIVGIALLVVILGIRTWQRG
ncbi:MAG: hypothetical protein ABEJ77_02700 [Halanaeroarchaeum sp.]